MHIWARRSNIARGSRVTRASPTCVRSCAGYLDYPFLNKERGAGRERYMRQNTWPICQSYWVSCRAVDVRRFCKDYRKSSLLYWLLRMSMLNPRRETKQEHFMKEAALVEAVCRSRWSSWGSSDACCFRRSHFDLTSTRAMACPCAGYFEYPF